MSEATPKFKITIDGHTVEVDPGTTILNAARLLGVILCHQQCATILV
jgi:NADH dehydrogenase/NADH:ubiquinone oxidoreductase subunit G